MKKEFVKVYFGDNYRRTYEFITNIKLEKGQKYSIETKTNEFDLMSKKYNDDITVVSVSNERDSSYRGPLQTIVDARIKFD